MDNDNPLLEKCVYRRPKIGGNEQDTIIDECEYKILSAEGFRQYIELERILSRRHVRGKLWESLWPSLIMMIGFSLVLLCVWFAPMARRSDWLVLAVGLTSMIFLGLYLTKLIGTKRRVKCIRPVLRKFLQDHPLLLPTLRSQDDSLSRKAVREVDQCLAGEDDEFRA